MAQRYLLVPLPEGLFRHLDLNERAVLGALYDRIRLSEYNYMGAEHPESYTFWDDQEESCFCVYNQSELGKQLGISDRTVRRCLERLKQEGFVWWRKMTYKGANRYFLRSEVYLNLKTGQ